MAATFCLRLALGMLACLLILPLSEIPPRFARVQFLSSLGLTTAALFFLRDDADASLIWAGFLSLGGCFLGSIVWHLDGAPFGRTLAWASVAALGIFLVVSLSARQTIWEDDFASAGVLGMATSAMLMGHSYLISPAMSLKPLYALLIASGVCLFARTAMALYGLWTSHAYGGILETEMALWLGTRWLLGILLPLGLGWMAWETARIRSTQSATGILYVLVIVTFLGELTSLLLVERTHIVM